MLRVKYPTTHGLDGKWHELEILEARKENEKILIKCKEKGKEVYLEVTKKGDTWYKVPHTKAQYITLLAIVFFKKTSKDVTEEMKRELDGHEIVSLEEHRKKLKMYIDPRTGYHYIELAAWYEIIGKLPPKDIRIRGKFIHEDDFLSSLYCQISIPYVYDDLAKRYEIETENFIIEPKNKKTDFSLKTPTMKKSEIEKQVSIAVLMGLIQKHFDYSSRMKHPEYSELMTRLLGTLIKKSIVSSKVKIRESLLTDFKSAVEVYQTSNDLEPLYKFEEELYIELKVTETKKSIRK